MQCINPIKAAHKKGGGLTYNGKNAEPGMDPFQFGCRKCLPCRLNNAREKAIRCWHESKLHSDSIFLTLTYNEESLKGPRLCYADFQKFMKRLLKERRKGINDPDVRKTLSIPYMVTGEYGDKNKRPHWHALLFNYRPADSKKIRTTELGHNVFTSALLDSIWGMGMVEFGDLTIDSASYVARYASKKLTHGKDQDHDFHPIHKTSSKHAIGKRWIEKYWKQTFEHGYVTLEDGTTKSKIPRYYVDWFRENHPEEFMVYDATVRKEIQKKSIQKQKQEEEEYLREISDQKPGEPRPLEKKNVKVTILKQKFKRLQEKLKL